MSSTQRITDRLPEFYKAREKSSLLKQFLDGFGQSLGEAERDIYRIMRDHWVDTAKGTGLDELGAVFLTKRHPSEEDEPYRRRIKRALQEYKGGGTVEAIRLALRSLLVPLGDQVEIVEFPPTPARLDLEVSSGDTWKVSSLGIRSVVPAVTIKIESADAEARDPQVLNKTTGQSIGLRGILKSGQELNIEDGRATIDNQVVTDRLTSTAAPAIPRYESEWQYTEFLQGKIGVFDRGTFDEAFFATPLPRVRIGFNWITMKASTVEVRIPRSVMDRTGIREAEIVQSLNAIKAAGVEMRIKIVETNQPPGSTPASTPPRSPTVSPPLETPRRRRRNA